MSNRPRVNAACRIEPTELKELCEIGGHETPGVTLVVSFDLHDHKSALAVLDQVVASVREQIQEATP